MIGKGEHAVRLRVREKVAFRIMIIGVPGGEITTYCDRKGADGGFVTD